MPSNPPLPKPTLFLPQLPTLPGAGQGPKCRPEVGWILPGRGRNASGRGEGKGAKFIWKINKGMGPVHPSAPGCIFNPLPQLSSWWVDYCWPGVCKYRGSEGNGQTERISSQSPMMKVQFQICHTHLWGRDKGGGDGISEWQGWLKTSATEWK